MTDYISAKFLSMNKLYFSGLMAIALFAWSCDKDDDDNTSSDENPVELSPEVEVYVGSKVQDNLTMIIENGGTFAHLIDKTGKKYHTWEFEKNLGNDVELLEDGTLIGMFKSENPTFNFGGYGGIVEIINSDNSIAWSREVSSATQLAHHDVEMLPNGNVLFLVWDRIFAGQNASLGINADHDVYVETLLEINPTTDEIVWKWQSADHLIQDYNPSGMNFGVVADSPERIDINYNLQDNGDFMHANGIDYDEEKDLIYMSVNFFNEVWVIDHSTTLAEASGSTGGNYGKGGDLVYRFGNPRAYDNNMGEVLFDRNHFPNLIEGDKPGVGNLLIYVNGNSTEQSSVLELDFPNTFILESNRDNEPEVVWSFSHPELFFGKLSGATRLSNGNTLICEGNYGYWEVSPTGEICWKYNGPHGTYWRAYGYDSGFPGLAAIGVEY